MERFKASRAWPMLVMVTFLSACAPTPPMAPQPRFSEAAPTGFPGRWYRDAAASGEQVLRVDPAGSLVEIGVGRDGPLAPLGHDHVVSSRTLKGYVAPAAGRADLYVQLDSLAVDEPALRHAAGLEVDLSPQEIEATRRNMLDKVLESSRYPFAQIGVRRIDDAALLVTLTLHGVSRTQRVAAQIGTFAGGIEVSGRMAFNQSDFGIAPLAIMGGALRVQDRLTLRFRVRAAA